MVSMLGFRQTTHFIYCARMFHLSSGGYSRGRCFVPLVWVMQLNVYGFWTIFATSKLC